MASASEVEAVLHELVDRLNDTDPSLRRALLPPRRTLEAEIRDLDVAYHATLVEGQLSSPTAGPFPGRADIRVAADSDDLLGLASGELGVVDAYASGRLVVEAPMMDLLRLRGLL